MQHFSCDLCGKDMSSDCDRRYVVRMEVFDPRTANCLTEGDLDQDDIDDLANLLEGLDGGQLEVDVSPAYKQMRFDLCPDCHRKFLKDPLHKELIKFDFSEN